MRRVNKILDCSAQILILLACFFVINVASAEDVLGYLTDKEGRYTGPTVEDNVAQWIRIRMALRMYMKYVLF